METKDRQLQEQQAPDKNTDNAFVRVGSDGHPVIPQTDSRNGDTQEQAASQEQNPNQQKKSS